MIVGTAGHIDHGKTALVRALTGVDCDRLPEEKARGITIELGYAYAADGRLGFVDVPGHERFVATMLAGAAGIDCLLLVVAADDGVMPQTVEHLEIAGLLGVGRGAVAISKIDRVDAVRLEAVRAQIIELLAPTRLAGAPLFPVSATSGAGVAALRAHLERAAAEPPPAGRGSQCRLAIDRSFTLAGVGTVVTGTLFAGELRPGDELTVAPQGRPARVRGLHVQGRPAALGRRGERCAVALAGFARDEVARGDWLVAPDLDAPTARLDLSLHLLGREARPLADGARVHVHLGAAHRVGRIALLEGESLVPGGRMLAQLVLEAPIHCAAFDACVLRDASASRTLGGGPVLDPHPPARYRRRPERLAVLRALTIADDGAALAALVEVAAGGVDLDGFVRDRNCAAPPLPVDAVSAGGRLFSAAVWADLQVRLLAALAEFHAHHADELGPQLPRLARLALPQHEPAVTASLVAALLADGRVARTGPWLHLPDHAVRLTAEEEALAARLRPRLANLEEPVWVRDLAREQGRDEQALRHLLLRLARRGELLAVVRDLYVTPALAARYAAIVASLEREEGGVPAARFRDATGLGRKRAIQLLEFFDRLGYTRRAGATHRLRGAAAAMFAAGDR